MAFSCTVMSLKGYLRTNRKAIVGYSSTVSQLDTKLAFLKIASWKQLCVVMINADIWSNLMITYG